MSDKAVGSGKVTAADRASLVFEAFAVNQVYIYNHPRAVGAGQARLQDIRR